MLPRDGAAECLNLQKKKERLEDKVKKMLLVHMEEDKMEDEDTSEKINKDKKIEKLIKQAERIERFLQENEAKPGKQLKEIKSNITDNESALMQTSHGSIQGYNAQALVDSKHQVIMQADAFGTGTDHHHLRTSHRRSQRKHGGNRVHGRIF